MSLANWSDCCSSPILSIPLFDHLNNEFHSMSERFPTLGLSRNPVRCHLPAQEPIPTKIGIIPQELLATIFLIGHRECSSTFSVSISQVCRRWRCVAVSLSGLWTTIDIRKDDYLTQLFLHRSRIAPLDVLLTLNPSLECLNNTHGDVQSSLIRRYQRFTSLLQPHTHRFRRIVFHFHYPVCLVAALKLLMPPYQATESILDTLDLRCLPYYDARKILVHHRSICDHINLSPSHLRYEGLPMPPPPLFSSNLRSLDLRWLQLNGDMRGVSMAGFLFNLKAAERLEVLRLTGSRRWWERSNQLVIPELPGGEGAEIPINLPCLQEAYFEGIDPQALTRMFRLIETPALQTLGVDFSATSLDATQITQALITINERLLSSSSPFERIHLTSCINLHYRAWRRILETFPVSTAELSFTFCDISPRAFDSLIWHPEKPIVACPQLSSFTVKDDTCLSSNFVIELVESRLSMADATGNPSLNSFTFRGPTGAHFDIAMLSQALQDKIPNIVLETTDTLDPRCVEESDQDTGEESTSAEEDFASGDEEVIQSGRA